MVLTFLNYFGYDTYIFIKTDSGEYENQSRDVRKPTKCMVISFKLQELYQEREPCRRFPLVFMLP